LLELSLPVIISVTGLVSGAFGAAIQAVMGRKPATITAEAAVRAAEAAAQGKLNEGFAALAAETMAQLREAKGEIQLLRGEIMDLIQHIDALERRLREANVVDLPPRLRPHAITLTPPTPQASR
jgi:hypothetical protein